MGWISIEDRMPPNFLKVLVECSGYCNESGMYADHAFKLGWYIIPEDETEGEWHVDSCNEISFPTVHAWLYQGDAVYEQMSIEDFLKEAESGATKSV